MTTRALVGGTPGDQERRVAVVGLDTRDEPDNVRAFERKFGITYPSVVDPDGELLVAFRRTLAPAAISTTLIIDREGRMAAWGAHAADRTDVARPARADHRRTRASLVV